jgi:putative membrane protein
MDVKLWIVILVLAIIIELISYGLISIWFIPSIILTIVLKAFGLNNIYIEIIIVLSLSTVLLIFTRPLVLKFLKPQNIKTNFDRILDMKGKIIKKVNLNDFGIVKVDGKEWRCYASKEIEVGKIVKIIKIDSNKLEVEEV